MKQPTLLQVEIGRAFTDARTVMNDKVLYKLEQLILKREQAVLYRFAKWNRNKNYNSTDEAVVMFIAKELENQQQSTEETK